MNDSETARRVEVHPGCEAVVRFDPERTFECVDECTWCCHHGVLLYEPDVYALSERANLADATTTFRGVDFVRREPKDRNEHVAADGSACHFLREDGLCAMQAEHGWKPTRCSVFPLDVTVEDGDLHVDVRDSAERNCEGMDVSERRLIDNLDAFLPPVLWDLEDPTTEIEL